MNRKIGLRHTYHTCYSYQGTAENQNCRSFLLYELYHKRYRQNICSRKKSVYPCVYSLKPHSLKCKSQTHKSSAYNSFFPVGQACSFKLTAPYNQWKRSRYKKPHCIRSVGFNIKEDILFDYEFASPEQSCQYQGRSTCSTFVCFFDWFQFQSPVSKQNPRPHSATGSA